jgi:hypothetical protein
VLLRLKLIRQASVVGSQEDHDGHPICSRVIHQEDLELPTPCVLCRIAHPPPNSHKNPMSHLHIADSSGVSEEGEVRRYLEGEVVAGLIL